jgi:O-antigen/teichoic acid export membrane protein
MLREKTIKAIAWQSTAKIVVQAFSFAVTIILARKLAPADYGLVGMAAVFTGLLDLVNGFGVNSAIVQRQDLSREELSSAFWFVFLLGCGLCCIGFLVAPAAALFYRNDQVSWIIRALSINFVISAVKTIPQSILNKQLMFNKTSQSELVSSIANGSSAILLAFTGFGVWSLVCGSIVQSVVSTVLICFFASWRPSLVFAVRHLQQVVGFGTKIVTSRIQWYVYSNSDYFIIGRLLGDKILGFYTMAFRLANLPTEKITAVINEVMFPVFSSLQHEQEKQKKYFLTITKFISFATMPIMALIIVLSEEIVSVLLTEKWLPIVTPLRILCFIGIIRSVDIVIPQVLVSQGRADEVLRYSTLLFFILPSSFFAGCYWGGMQGVAYAWLMAYPLLVSVLFRCGFRAMGLSAREYAVNMLPQTIGTVIMCALLFGMKIAGAMPGMGLTRLIFLSLVGVFIYLAYLLSFHKGQVLEVVEILKSLRKGSKPEEALS